MSDEAKLTAIYVLRDEHGAVRYVGKAVNPKKRFDGHRWPSPTLRSPCANWCRSLRERGLKPTMEVIEWVKDWHRAERAAIKRFRKEGADLLNVTPGGRHTGPYRQSRSYPAYKHILAFCRRTKNRELSALVQKRAKEMMRRGIEHMNAFDTSLFQGLLEAVPLRALRLLRQTKRQQKWA